ncbi:sesquipedalian-1-like [Panonychus citri]|uniref:sesquipedalian-1-like n=1 Tax=Panonychus citri TaxID=50023 RepID=UPI002308361E|nr:sesquipedalian-1-like [Panonychus citri]
MKINEKTLIRYSTSNMVPADVEGYLYKRGEVNRNFQKRWCILKGNCLFYFEKKNDKEPLGCILLEGSRIDIDDSEADLFAFKLVFADCRDYIFATDNSDSQEKWMKCLSQASYSYLKMVVAELQRQLDEINLAERRRINETREEGSNNDRPQRSNPFNSSREDLIDLEETNTNNQGKSLLFSRRPFIEIHQYYGLQFRGYFQSIKEKVINESEQFNSNKSTPRCEVDLLS